MSWSGEEWKSGLPVLAIERITSMEETIENYKKEITQIKCKTENLESYLNETKRKLEDETKEKTLLERELTSLTSKLQNEEDKFKRLRTNFTQKESIIVDLNEKITALKTESENNHGVIQSLEHQLEALNLKCNETDIRARESSTKLNKVTEDSNQIIEELNKRLADQQRENSNVHTRYEEKLQQAFEQQQKLQDLNENLRERVAVHQAEKTKSEMLLAKEQTEGQERTQAFQNNLLEQNQQLREEIQALRRLINDRSNPELANNPTGGWSLEEMDHVPTRDNQHQGQNPRSNPSSSYIEKEVTLNVDRCAAESVSGGSTPRLHASSIAVTSSKFQDDGGKLVQDGGVYYSPQNHISALQREVKKLQAENCQMREVYESHMRVCANTALKKSSSVELDNGELKKQLQVKEKCRQELERMLLEEKTRNSHLQRELQETNNNQKCENSSSNSVEDILSILKKRGDADTLNAIVRQFSADITENFMSSQDSIQSAHACTREKFSSQLDRIERILRAGGGVGGEQQRTPKSNRKEGYSPRTKSSEKTFRFEKSTFKQTSGPGGCISELENIKSAIGSLQESLHSYSNDIRKVEKERDHLQEELLKMVDVVQKKEEETNRMRVLFETEKRKSADNDACFRREMDALKSEQLEIYEEFRDMCDNLKRKDVELLNKQKEMKLATKEWRQQEDSLREQLSSLRDDHTKVTAERQRLESELSDKSKENGSLLKRILHATDQMQILFDNLTRVDLMFQEAKKRGLYH